MERAARRSAQYKATSAGSATLGNTPMWKERLRRKCIEDVTSKRSKLIRKLRASPASVGQVGQSIVDAMQSECRAEDPDDPHGGLTNSEYQELMASLEGVLLGLLEEEDLAAKQAEQEMAEMFLASLSLEQQEYELQPAVSSEMALEAAADDAPKQMAAVAAAAEPEGAQSGGMSTERNPSPPTVPPTSAAACPLCSGITLLQRHSVVFCASPECNFRLNTGGDSRRVAQLSAQATQALASHNLACAAAPALHEREQVLFLECAECHVCEVVL